MPSASSPANLHIANGLRLAAADLADARTLRGTGSRNAAYHAQQAAEKLVLVLLTSEGVHAAIRESHQLDILLDKLPPEHPLQERLRSISFLTIFATTYRYPKPGGRLPGPPDWPAVDSAIEEVDRMIAQSCRHFGVTLAASDAQPARTTAPMREL